MSSNELDQAKQMLAELDANSTRALVRAVNYAAVKARTLGARLIRDEVKLPAAYVNARLKVDQRASATDPSAMISGRGRATQLSRFGAKQLTTKAKLPGKRRLAGARVEVTPGRKKVLAGAWLMKQKGGNTGLMVRTGPNRNDYKPLYGPSIDQLWRNIREQVAPEVSDLMLSEFIRQMELT
ncbi:MAG: phage tail protein [Oceanisphaera sp.]|uniref:phage tail protein n=1 Tax=Oceanisphaera sp. TaxID=1929979 RepID=UPI003C78AAB9